MSLTKAQIPSWCGSHTGKIWAQATIGEVVVLDLAYLPALLTTLDLSPRSR
jgi:hypothetical protein